ncbi:MAG: BON domain-containing protein [Candidatus Acidiferrales bacterium]
MRVKKKQGGRLMIRFAKTLLLAMLALPLLGIGTLQAKQQHNPPQKGTQRYSAWLQQEVRHQLMLLPWYTVFDNLEYSVNGYTVTLKGQVVNPSVKSDAEAAVKHIEGVEKVNNEIEVLPNSPMDNQIRFAEYRKIYSQPSLQRYGVGNLQSIHIIIKNGHVTLEGFVSSEADKNVAGIQANSVPNVFSVTNNLQVDNSK